MTHQVTHQDTPDTLQDPPDTHRFVPMAEAVRILGLSATMIRRKVTSGELEAERITRPQGEAWLIRVKGDLPPATADPPGVPQEPPGTLQDPPGSSHHAPPGADVLTVVVVPLLAEVAASRQILERQAQQLVSQAEMIGTLRARIAMLETSGAPQAQDPTPGAVRALVAPLARVAGGWPGRRRGRLGELSGVGLDSHPSSTTAATIASEPNTTAATQWPRSFSWVQIWSSRAPAASMLQVIVSQDSPLTAPTR